MNLGITLINHNFNSYALYQMKLAHEIFIMALASTSDALRPNRFVTRWAAPEIW
jgi:hypothetical protein